MKRHFFLSDDLDELEQVERDLEKRCCARMSYTAPNAAR